MKKQKHIRTINAALIAAALTAVFIAASTIGGELYHPYKSWLKETFYHHWIGKGILSVILFFAATALLRAAVKTGKRISYTFLMALFWVVLISVLSIFFFYLYELFA